MKKFFGLIVFMFVSYFIVNQGIAWYNNKTDQELKSRKYRLLYQSIKSESEKLTTQKPNDEQLKMKLTELKLLSRIREEAGAIVAAALDKACKKHGVSLADAAALAWAESEYDPRARSKKGALGLMQLMPPTFKSIGGKEPFDPFENADKGVKYFKKMLLRFKGNKRLALAAYNAGPRNVRQKKAHEWKEPKNHFTKFCAKKIELLAQ